MKSLATLLLMMNLLLLGGCTIGPKTEIKRTFINKYDKNGRPIKIGKVDENVKVKLRYITEKGDEFIGTEDIGGWDVSPPPLPEPKTNAPAPAK